MDYKTSGVDIDAGNETVRRIKDLARATFTPGVLSDIGLFGGLFRFDQQRYREPVLVASTDGVGTKLKVAFLAGRHDTVGADLVNHCVNDILVQGARPLFFLDYLATGRLSPDVAEQVVRGLARGCQENGCALLGGETAEMPGFYAAGEYDLAGFIVGVVDRDCLIDGRSLRVGDRLIGLASSGLHTNGYSLARRIVFEKLGLTVDSHVPELQAAIGDALLQPHRSYLKVIEPLLGMPASGVRRPASDVERQDVGLRTSDFGRQSIVKGLAHITGGGITDNLPRILPEGISAKINRGSWPIPPLFSFLERAGDVPIGDMYRTFNMGIGMIVACAPEDVDHAVDTLAASGEKSWLIGELIPGSRGVCYEPPGLKTERPPSGGGRQTLRSGARSESPKPTAQSPEPSMNRNLGVLISGRGSNLQAIIRAIADGRLDARIAVVISNRADAAGLQRARDAGIETVCISHRDFATREDYDRRLVQELRARDVGLVCLAGFMRFLSPVFIEAFPNAILNIHPSLLPAFPGLEAQHQAWEHGVKVSGATVHLVSCDLDAGPIVLQVTVPVLDSDTAETLAARILVEEHKLYPEAIRLILAGGWQVVGRRFMTKSAV
jgi:formyltetrahydrofolate-dependent phosphoribosylglycinamide formyltransferase